MFGANLQHIRQLALAAGIEISLHSYVRHPSPEELAKKAEEAAQAQGDAFDAETRPLFSISGFAKPMDKHPYEDDPQAPRIKSILTKEILSDDYRLQRELAQALLRDKSEAGVGTIEEGCFTKDGGHFIPCFDSAPGITREQLEDFLRTIAISAASVPTRENPLFHLLGAKIFETGKGFHVIADHVVHSSFDECTVNDWLAEISKLSVVDKMWLDYLDKDDDLILRVTAGPGRPLPTSAAPAAAAAA